MLRPDGVRALVEMTRPLFSFDLIAGLFEGWCVDWHALPTPHPDVVAAASAPAQVRRGADRTPTSPVHGTADDLILWQQSRCTYGAWSSAGWTRGWRWSRGRRTCAGFLGRTRVRWWWMWPIPS